jgi:flagellar basal body-associated protein FliL
MVNIFTFIIPNVRVKSKMDNSIKKENDSKWFKILIILLLVLITISSALNTFYLFSINTKLSLLPTMDLSGIENSIKQIGESLDIGVFDMFK